MMAAPRQARLRQNVTKSYSKYLGAPAPKITLNSGSKAAATRPTRSKKLSPTPKIPAGVLNFIRAGEKLSPGSVRTVYLCDLCHSIHYEYFILVVQRLQEWGPTCLVSYLSGKFILR
jgi:hypothetical protein